MDQLSDEQLRELLATVRGDAPARCDCKVCARVRRWIPIVEELLERRATERNADIKEAEMRRWNGEE